MASNPFATYYNSAGSGGHHQEQESSNVAGEDQHEPMGAGMAEVDLSKYPQPKDSTKKIRSRTDVIEYFFGGPVNRELLIAKAFYFLFFSAFGSLLPLMAIYFKNMGMTPTQAGILIGIRPFVGYLSAPFWADLADRFKKGKVMLIGSLAAWIIFNVPIGFIKPPATSCLVYNETGFYIDTPKSLQYGYNTVRTVKKRSITGGTDEDSYENYDQDIMGWTQAEPEWITTSSSGGSSTAEPSSADKLDYSEVPWNQLLAMEDDETMDVDLADGRRMRVRRSAPSPMKPTHEVGMSPYTLEFALNYNAAKHGQWVSPTFSYTIFQLNDVRKVFFLFLLLIVIGEFFCCPSMTLADTAVLNLLGTQNADQYGRQRMFASIGWGLTMFFVCLTLDHSHTFSNHPCQVHERERNYTVCYVSFTLFMIGTMLVATRLPFDIPTPNESSANLEHMDHTQNPATVSGHADDEGHGIYRVPGAPGSWYHPKGPPPPPPTGHDHHTAKEVVGDALKNLLGKSKVFAQTTRQIPEWMPVLRHFANIRCATFMFVAWFMGFGIGLIFTFLFWHLQDYGGTSTVFGMASVVNHISEMLAYFLSYPLIRKLGHIKVLCLGIFCSVLRFLYISYIREPWGVIPFELIQGVTHSAVWAAACSYIAHNTPPELRISAQGVLSFVHNGAGRACGTIFGGLFSTYYGTTAVLRGYGFACIFVLAGFMLVCFYHRDKGFTADLTPAEDPHEMNQVTALAPHGVPSNPTIVRTASHANLDGSGAGSGKTYSTSNLGNLDLPAGHTNPFLPGGHNGGYGGQQGSSVLYEQEEYSGITMNPTEGSGSYHHYNNSQY